MSSSVCELQLEPDPQAPEAGQAGRPGQPQRIRSFVARSGRVGPGQQRALRDLGPRFIVPFRKEQVDWVEVFGRDAPRVLEIGFGMGGATAAIADARPDTDFIGVEVHEPGVGALLKLIDEKALTNLRIVQHDAVEVSQHMVAPRSLAGVHIYFPDPWHKKRHHKRRLIQPDFVRQLVNHLAPGGYLHCATDWEPYARQMLEVLSAEPALHNTCEGYAPRPEWRPMTKFEHRGMKLGHGVWDLVFIAREP
jgi:tRNA (guanine-N7-)-methyltransferase